MLKIPSPSAILRGRKFAEIPAEEMRALLNNIMHTKSMRRNMYAGVEFYHWMLETHGVKAVSDFVRKASHILDTEGALEIYDLEKMHAKPEFRKIRKMAPRDFLRTGAWSIPGAVSLVYGVAETGKEGARVLRNIVGNKDKEPPPSPEVKATVLGHISEWIGGYLGPPAEALIGAALLNEGIHAWQEIRLRHISNVTAELAKIAGMHRRINGR